MVRAASWSHPQRQSFAIGRAYKNISYKISVVDFVGEAPTVLERQKVTGFELEGIENRRFENSFQKKVRMYHVLAVLPSFNLS